MLDVSLPAALFGGLISFLSPCVLPLVPPYLSFLAGRRFDQLAPARTRRLRRRAFLASLLFVRASRRCSCCSARPLPRSAVRSASI